MNKCEICEKLFVPNKYTPKQKYCSKECSDDIHGISYDKKYYQEHKEEIKQRIKEYSLLNSVKISIYQHNYGIINRTELSEKSSKRYNERLKTDINFKLRHYLAKRLYTVLQGIDKSESTIRLLGCSVDFLKQHLESKFVEGMSWSNYGKWHIDHIRPCCSFDLSKPEEQRKCFNWNNLQPLWAKDNLIKNGKY
jgi:hypothetical protein